MASAFLTHPDLLLHDTGPDHPENTHRLLHILSAIDGAGLLKKFISIPFSKATLADASLVHSEAYVELLRIVCGEGFTFIGSQETHICPRSHDAAMLAVGAVLAGCDAVVDSRAERAFCAIRPPGHHATRDQAGGFCLLNNVAIGAEHLIRRHSLERVAIVDFDAHHGNGTQEIFYDRGDVLYISLHQHPRLGYPGTGYKSEKGKGAGVGFTVNIPMPPGAKDEDYREAFEMKVMPALDRFAPQFLLLSAGFDAVTPESLARLDLKSESFYWMTRMLMESANRHCGGRLVSVLEGGYHMPTLGKSVVEHAKSLVE